LNQFKTHLAALLKNLTTLRDSNLSSPSAEVAALIEQSRQLSAKAKELSAVISSHSLQSINMVDKQTEFNSKFAVLMQKVPPIFAIIASIGQGTAEQSAYFPTASPAVPVFKELGLFVSNWVLLDFPEASLPKL